MGGEGIEEVEAAAAAVLVAVWGASGGRGGGYMKVEGLGRRKTPTKGGSKLRCLL